MRMCSRYGFEDFGKESNAYGVDGALTSRVQLDGIIEFMR